MTQKPFTKPLRYIHCPACGQGEHQVCHLPVGIETAWYCDECGVRFSVRIVSLEAVDCEVMAGQTKEKRLVTLKSNAPVTLLVEGMAFLPDDDEDGHMRYFYNEHTCPTNYLGRVREVYDEDGNTDPHGVFEFVSIAPWVDEE